MESFSLHPRLASDCHLIGELGLCRVLLLDDAFQHRAVARDCDVVVLDAQVGLDGLRMLPKGTHDFRKFIRPSELERWARSAGLVLKELTGMSFNPLTQQYKLGTDVDVNYLVWLEKPG